MDAPNLGPYILRFERGAGLVLDHPITRGRSGAERVENNGSVVVVANASGVGGSAGAMTTELSLAGFETGEPANALEQQEASTVHFTEAEGAQEDAELVAELLGGVEVSAVPDPAPIDGEFTGDVLVLLGADEAGQTLDELNL